MTRTTLATEFHVTGDATEHRVAGKGPRRSTNLRVGLPVALWLALGCGGCGRAPQFPAKDERLLESLRTAVSARKTEWLEASAKKIEAAHQQRDISDEGFEALQAAIDDARAGDWTQAETRIIQLEKAQRPPTK